jgi:hypothetical protein
LSGIIPWNDPTSDDVKAAATVLSQNLVPTLTRFAFDPDMAFTTYIWERVHFGVWSVAHRTLHVGVNLDSQVRTIPFNQLPTWKEDAKLDVLYGVDTKFEPDYLLFEGLGATGFTLVVSE